MTLQEHRTLQEQLDEADALLDVVFARAPVGLAFFDDELRFVRVNDRLAAINGLPAASHLGRRVREVLPGLPRDVEDDLRRVLETGQPLIEVEVSGITHASRKRREWLASYWPVRPAGLGMVTGIGAVVFDVTDRRIARRAIRAQADRYEALLLALSEAGEGLVVVEDDGHCVYANAAFEQISGYTFPELATLDSLLELTRPPTAGPAAPTPGHGFAEGAETLALRRRDGTFVEVEAAGVPLETDVARHLVVLVRDVSERRRADAERERLLARAALAGEAAEALGAAGDEAAALDALARLCVRELADTCVAVLGSKPGAVRRTAVAARDAERERALVELQLRYPLDEQPHRAIEDVLRSGQARIIENLGDDHLRSVAVDDRHLELLRTLAMDVAVIVPLRARGEVRGVLATGLASGDAEQRELAAAALEELGRIAALALDAARLEEERAATARTLRRALLPPSLPEIPGVELAARHLPGGTEVGGDFYDCFEAGGGEWAVAIGDVCGRGAEAAAITTLARCTLRAAVLRDRRPDAVLRELNDAVLGQGAEFRFCTALHASVRPRAGGADVTLASGGHPLPLVLRAGGAVEGAGRAGTLLGVVPNPELTATEVRLEAGDALVLFTDGAAAPGEDLAAFLRGCAGRDAERIAAALEERALAAAGGRLRDDAAMVVLRAAV